MTNSEVEVGFCLRHDRPTVTLVNSSPLERQERFAPVFLNSHVSDALTTLLHNSLGCCSCSFVTATPKTTSVILLVLKDQCTKSRQGFLLLHPSAYGQCQKLKPTELTGSSVLDRAIVKQPGQISSSFLCSEKLQAMP